MPNRRGFTLPGLVIILAVIWALVMTVAVGILYFQTRPAVARIDRNGQELTDWARGVQAQWRTYVPAPGVPCTAPGVPPGCTDPPPTPPPPPDWD